MKDPDRNTVSQLEALPNIGKAIADLLQMIGIEHPQQLIGKDPFALHQQLRKKKGAHVDYCVLDTFMAAVDFMEGGESKPWWEFTKKRKEILKIRNAV